MKNNDYQLALDYLIENIEILNRHSDGAFCIPCWSKNKLQELVNKSKPLKPIRDYGLVPHYSCPKCSASLDLYSNSDNRIYCDCCPRCGQRLDWGRE